MRILFYILLGYLAYRFARSVFSTRQKIKRGGYEGELIDEMVQDPSCKTYIPLMDAHKRVINGREYFFCSRECADKFSKTSPTGTD
jgi:YHS domain-containing protein